MNFLIITLFIYLGNSESILNDMCHTPHNIIINGKNITQISNKWIKFQPFDISLIDQNKCIYIEYKIKNINNKLGDNIMYFSSPGINDQIIECYKSCNFIIDCEKINDKNIISKYLVMENKINFNYQIIIGSDIYNEECELFILFFFIFGIFIVLTTTIICLIISKHEYNLLSRVW